MPAKRKTKDRILKLIVKPQQLDLALGILFQQGILSLEQRKQKSKILLTAELPRKSAILLKNLRISRSFDGKALFEKIQIATLTSRKWADEYKKNLKPFPFVFRNSKDKKYSERALLWIDPRAHAKVSAKNLCLEAGLAFGTGTHPTTQLCAESLAEQLTQFPIKKVLDLGCGTGLLAMVAAKLGAPQVWAIDNDPIALEVAQENLTKNQLTHIRLTEDLKESPPQFNLIVANILLNTLLELKGLILSRLAPQATLIVSGLLYKDCQELIQAYTHAGLKFISRKNRKGWSALLFKKA